MDEIKKLKQMNIFLSENIIGRCSQLYKPDECPDELKCPECWRIRAEKYVEENQNDIQK